MSTRSSPKVALLSAFERQSILPEELRRFLRLCMKRGAHRHHQRRSGWQLRQETMHFFIVAVWCCEPNKVSHTNCVGFFIRWEKCLRPKWGRLTSDPTFDRIRDTYIYTLPFNSRWNIVECGLGFLFLYWDVPKMWEMCPSVERPLRWRRTASLLCLVQHCFHTLVHV